MNGVSKLFFPFNGTRAELNERLQALGEPKYGTHYSSVTFHNLNAVSMESQKNIILDDTNHGPHTRNAYDIGSSSRFEPAHEANVHYLYIPILKSHGRYPNDFEMIEMQEIYTQFSDFSDVAPWFNNNIQNADTIQFRETGALTKTPRQGISIQNGSKVYQTGFKIDSATATAWTGDHISGPEINLPMSAYDTLKKYAKSLTINRNETTYDQQILSSTGYVRIWELSPFTRDLHNDGKEKTFVSIERLSLTSVNQRYPDIHQKYAETMGFNPDDSLSEEAFIRTAVPMRFHCGPLRTPATA